MTRTRLIVLLAVAALVAAAAAFGGLALLVSVFERKQEARTPHFRTVELTEASVDPALWGRDFPLQYDSYRKTVDMVRTRHGGSEAMPRVPTATDPRSVVSQSKIEEDPRLAAMWAGYAFSKDFREERGHAYMLEDQTFTGRQQAAAQPGACLSCHASMVAAWAQAGDGDTQRGFERINAMPYAEARALVDHPVACIDCHDPETLALRITRPAFQEGIAAYQKSRGVDGYDVNRDATRQEMRSYVCGQCHVEYYFAGPEKRLTYPWARGLRADEILAYYDETGFKDWTHATSGAPALKAQHPEFEMWSQGIHGRSGVTCADCHMPYQRQGGAKVSDHHVRSPLLNVNAACQTCHRASEAELVGRVVQIQDRHLELRDLALDAVLDLTRGIAAAKAAGATDEALADSRLQQRHAQFLLDFAEAENSSGFHAPQEAARVLGKSIDASRRGLMALPLREARAPVAASGG